MLSDFKVSTRLVVATGLAFLIFISIGTENYTNWKFIASLFGLVGFMSLLLYDLIIRNKTPRNR